MRIDPKIDKRTEAEKIADITRKVAIAAAAAGTYYWFIKLVFLA